MGPSFTHQVLWASHPVAFMAPEPCGTSSALPSLRSPSRTQTPPKTPLLTLLSTTGGTQAVWWQFLGIPGWINFAGGKRQQTVPLKIPSHAGNT